MPQFRFVDWFSFWDKSIPLSKHKHFEIQVMWNPRLLVALELDFWTWSGFDHAGPRLNFALLGIEVNMSIYDSRHWDDDTDNWCIYPDEKQLYYDSRDLSVKTFEHDQGFLD